MAKFFSNEILERIVEVAMDHYCRLTEITTRLGINTDEQLKALRDGHPREATLTAGIALEILLHEMWREHMPDNEPVDDQLYTLINGLRRQIESDRIIQYMHAVRLARNRASHIGDGITNEDAVDSVYKLISILEWYAGEDGVCEDKGLEAAVYSLKISGIDESTRADLEIRIVNLMDTDNSHLLESCIQESNTRQDKIRYNLVDDTLVHRIRFETFQQDIHISSYLDMMERVRAELNLHEIKILAFVDNFLVGTVFSNLFAGRRSENGVGLVTTCNVEGIVIPRGKMNAYFEYMLAKAALDALNPHHEYHNDGTRAYCVYDYKENKEQLPESMREQPLCDQCRMLILGGENDLDADHFDAINKLFELSGEMLEGSGA